MATIEISDLHKRYGAVEIFRNLNLHVQDKEFVVLVGPSGCGKSTLLRMLAGLEDVTDGTISFDGTDVTDLKPKHRDVAMVFQNYALYPHMSVAKNMAFGLRMRGVTNAEIEQRVAAAAGVLGLTEYLERHPRELSGGQRQRVAMGRAIVRTPQVFLFDEPLSNLDALLRVDMRAEVKSLHQRLNATFVYVTHDQVEAMTMADRMVVMNNGTIEQVGAPLQVYDKPANVFVASFIGSPAMNMIRAKPSVANGQKVIRSDDGLTFPHPKNNTGCEGGLIVGFRPRDLNVVDKDTSGAIEAKVEIVEHTGVETLVYVRAGSHKLCMSIDKQEWSGLGESVCVLPDPANTHYFDETTKQRVG
ncbi:sn-glycerol-3-phosphate ABC transporter ATP-binding protein UgpC [Nitratireductor sp. XY-223]|uniref:ABC transporter ATP-binding protein n=1 Tax=Nitratireductor sp. XY-223 TaxID=2561926 RepID=UPI0010AB2B73|nr:sn-glycerol-3-phosphate ABC transporter ATP-binding protein UgpC [Nitratireductor sp. XY-223]